MFNRFIQLFSSLKLTFVLLAAGALLVLIGTLAQVKMGLYAAQNIYFRSFFVYWGPQEAGWKIPVLPGGYLLGTLLLINLLVAHLRYYRPGKKKVGIVLIHTGIVLLLLGQFATDFLQVESHMRLSEGQAKAYSESGRRSEVVILDTTDPDRDKVVAIDQSRLSGEAPISLPDLPLTLQVKQYLHNAQPEFVKPGEPSEGAKQGVGQMLKFTQLPRVTRMDARDVPAALVEVKAGAESLGSWWVSNWLTEDPLIGLISRQASPALRQSLAQSQTFTHDGRTYEIAMRPTRYYKPFEIELLDFKHDKYKGTEIPKNFSSRVQIKNPNTQESREVLIYMNHPLRHSGETFYQSGYDENDPRVTILQVVRNPGWLTPYLACVLVSLGMTIQFSMHLFGFINQRRAK